MTFDVVVPTAGRPSLAGVLAALRDGVGPAPARIIVVDDRRAASEPLDLPAGVESVRGGGRGPAAARNLGWRRASAPWIVFLDDDVVPARHWRAELEADLDGLPPAVAGSQGRIVVPMPADRRPTDWERNVRGLEQARWATADMAVRRGALELVGGFDERFPRAYREDSDLALRLMDAGLELVRGRRHVVHPVRPAGWTVSLRLQAGNADNALMDVLHGSGWRERAGAPAGRLRRHVAITGALAAGLLAPHRSLRRLGRALWAAGTAELAWARIAPGPRDGVEVARMLATSALLPPLAAGHWLRGRRRARRLVAQGGGPLGNPAALAPLAVLLDRDDTLIRDVPYNGDPDRVVALPGVADALDRLRSAGCRLAIVSNQSGIARGLLSEAEVQAVNARVQSVLGPFEVVVYCPHGPEDGCACRKPRPGLVLEAAARLGVAPSRCAVIGDIGADVEAARAAGARGILVPTERTRAEEIAAADEVVGSLGDAVARLLGPVTAREPVAA